MPIPIWMTAAHGGYNSERVPLGGGAAVCERLCRVWGAHPEVELTLLGSGPSAPAGVRYHRVAGLPDGVVPSQLSELRYARFCREFERGTTALIQAASARPVVFTHDISEGPDFTALAEARIPCLPIFHVDVVDYFNKFYLGGLLPVHWLTRLVGWWRRCFPIPDLLALVFDKQACAVASCPRLIVPSAPMASILARCYPTATAKPGKLIVTGWGAPDLQFAGPQVESDRQKLDGRLGHPLLATLSRISPEKGQDTLLQALLVGERRGEIPPGLTLAIAGESAYMRGAVYKRRLQSLANQLRQVKVEFVGHLGGPEKRAFLELADLFVVPSRHESYGLTTLEAMAAGTPVVGLASYGVQATVTAESGRVVPLGPRLYERLWEELRRLCADAELRERLGRGAALRARMARFEDCADRLLDVARELT